MSPAFNIYCDESCHLENDGLRVMVLGGVWCPTEKRRAIAIRIREIKARHRLPAHFEIKWTKVSPAKKDFYLDLVDYFFDDDDLRFRGILIPDKGVLDHASYGQSHDDWYYKMFFRLLEPIIDPKCGHYIYLDIKDTRSERKRARLEQILRSSRYDQAGRIIRRVQQIRSHESEILQLADLLIGAVSFFNRRPGPATGDPSMARISAAKDWLVNRIHKRSGKRLDQSTWLRESKFNLFRWEGGRP